MQYKKGLKELLSPLSVVVVGASENLKKNSAKPLSYLLKCGYQGSLYAVNPRHESVLGVPCYQSIDELPGGVDLAVITVPAEQVLSVLDACGRRNIPAAVILSSGFAEADRSGKELEREVSEAAAKHGIRLCGPNSVGIINNQNGLAATFSQALSDDMLTLGPLAFVSQSGNFGTFMAKMASDRRLGVAAFVSTGNETNTHFLDYCNALIDEPHVQMIGGYIEGLRDGANLRDVGQFALEAGKPIAVMKVGRSEASARAARSHTAALVGNDAVYDSALRQSRILRVRNEEQLLNAAAVLLWAPQMKGRRIAVLSVSGGGGTMLADSCHDEELEVPPLRESTQIELRKMLPTFSSATNPVDLTGEILTSSSGLGNAVEVVARDSNIDAIIVFLGMMHLQADSITQQLIDLKPSLLKPIIVGWIAGPETGIDALRAAKIPVITTSSTDVASALAAAATHSSWLQLGDTSASVHHRVGAEALEDNIGAKETIPCSQTSEVLNEASVPESLAYSEAAPMLEALGIRAATSREVGSLHEAQTAAKQLGFPLVMKIEVAGLEHKTEVGGVRTQIENDSQLIGAYADLETVVKGFGGHERNSRDTILVQEAIVSCHELLVGVTYDTQLGWVLSVGVGGVLVELLARVSVRVLPVGKRDIYEMFDEVGLTKLLGPYRARPASDIESAIASVLAFAEMPVKHKELLEAELNPLMVSPTGAVAVDAIIRLNRNGDRTQ